MSATLKDLYNALKKDGRFSEAKDFGTFAKKMNERGYSSMVYNTVRNAGANVPDIATFRKNLGVHVWKQGEGKNNVRVKPTSAVGKAAQSVEQERWGDTAPTQQEDTTSVAPTQQNSSTTPTDSVPRGQGPLLPTDNSPKGESLQTPMWAPNGSALVKGMQQAEMPKSIESPIDYTKPGVLVKSEKRRQKHLDDAFKSVTREYANEEYNRRNAPAFRTGVKGINDSMMKRQGQLEKELEDSANLLANDKSISDYLSNSIFGEFKDADKRAADISRGFTKTGTVSDAGVDIAQSMLGNQQKDPEKLLKNLQEKTKKSMISLLSAPDMKEWIKDEANRIGVPVDYFVQNALAPKIQERLSAEFDKAQVAKYLPKGTAEYVVSGINDSLIGTVLQMVTMNKSQRVYMQRANAMTQEGLNPNVEKPGMWTNAARGAMSFVGDAPLFALLSPIGGRVAAGVLGNGVKIAARAANASWYGRMGLMATQGAISQGTTGFIYGGLNSAVQNYSTGDDTSFANTMNVALGGAMSEGTSWATMGGFGGAVGGSLYKAGLNGTGKNMWRNGAAKIGSDVLKLGAEGMGMHLGGNMAKVVRGEDTNWFSTEGVLEDCANVVALKLTHVPKLLGKALSGKIGVNEEGKKESYAEFAARNFATYLISDAAKGKMFKFTREEKKEFKPYIDTFVADTKQLLRTKKAKASDADNEKIKTVYDQIMADENITWDAKAKYNALVMGTAPSVRPIMDYWTVATHGDDKVVEERAKDGTLLSRTTFDTTDAKNATVFRLLQDKERKRMWNSRSGLYLKDLDNKEIQKEYMRSIGYDFDNPNNPGNKVIEESMAKAREDFVNSNGIAEDADNIYRDWINFAFDHGELKKIGLEFLKEKGLPKEEFEKILYKEPWERTDEEHQIMLDYRRVLEKALFPEDKVHEEQSQQGGKDVAEENNLGSETPNGEAVKGTLAELNQAEKGLQALIDSNEVFASEYDRLKKQGLSNAQIYQALINSGMTQEELAPFAKYINANAKVQGMVNGTQKKIQENVQERVMEWSYKGELNGEKQSGENMVYVTDDKGRVLVVASGDVAFDAEGKPKEDVGDMLVVYDTTTGEVDFVSAKDVKFHSTESAEDYGKRYTQHLQELNSQAYVEAQQEGTSEKPQEPATEGNNIGGEIKIGNEKVLLSDEIDDNGKQFVLTNEGNLSFGEVEKESGLPSAPILLSEGMITNPSTKDGYGLVHIEARHGDQIRKAGYKSVLDFIENVAKNYEVIKEGNKRNGHQTYRLQLTDKHNNTLMIELSSDGSYWNINTAGIFKTSYGKKNKEVYNRHTTEKQSAETAGTSQSAEQSDTQTPSRMNVPTSSLGKDSNSSSESGENKQTLTFSDGTPIPMKTDSKGRQTGDLTKMSPEHGAEYLETTLGEMTDEFVDGKIKAAEKAVDKAKKTKVDMSGDVIDVQEAIAKKNEAIAKAEAELNMYTNIKKARAKKQLDEEAEGAIGSGGTDMTGRYDKEREQGYRIGEGNVRYDRQKEEDQTGEYGKDVTVAFSPDVKVKGKVKVVEADSVQASHSNGQQNPYHFGHDWQPKDRSSADSSIGASKIASNIDPEQITGDGNAFVGSAPSVNKRHEVIQGNNRTEALKRMYAGFPEQAAKYKQWLIDHAEEFGLNAEEIAKMKNPIMVNELPVDDATAKQLGQYVASDFETGGKRIPAESIVINKLGKRMENFTNILLSQGELGEDAKLSDLIMQNAGRVLEYLKKEGVINNTEANTLAKDKVALRQWLDGMLRAGLFEGDKQTEAAFNKLPENAKKAVLATYLRDVKSGEDARIKQNLQRSFEAYSDLMNNPDFANAKNLKEARAAVAAEIEHGNQSMFGEEPVRDRYSTFELELAALYKGLKDQKTLAGLFGKYFDAVQGDKATHKQLELGEEPREPIGKEEAIKEVFDSYDTVPAETQKQVGEAVKGVALEISKQVGEDLVVTDEGEAEQRLSENGSDESQLKFSKRERPAPKKTQKVYKLMRLGDDGKLYPLFIDSTAPTELGVWYDADSPDLSMLKGVESGVHLVDPKTGKVVSYDDFYSEHPELFNGKQSKYPSKEALKWAADHSMRFVFIEDTKKGQKRFGGESRKYWNLGVNGSGTVSTFSMRPGWHAGSLPTMRQIGKGKEKNLRDDRFVWVEGEVSADKDYTAEAEQNPDKDLPDRIPEDGFYMKATNADKAKSQADRVGWYVAGAFKANRIMSDREARSVIDKWNEEHPDKPVEYDYERESGREFNAETMRLEDVEGNAPKRKEFRTKDGEVYGFTDGKKIYLDTKKMKPDTPLHEYTHLWGAALRRTNAKEWDNVKGLLDKVDGLKKEIEKLYPELKGDDLYDEMLAMFSGREGTKKLEDVCRKLAAEEGKRVTDSAKEQGFIDKVKTALQKFWKATADLLHVHFTTAEDVADKVLADWARGYDPREKSAPVEPKVDEHGISIDADLYWSSEEDKRGIVDGVSGKHPRITAEHNTRTGETTLYVHIFDENAETPSRIKAVLEEEGYKNIGTNGSSSGFIKFDNYEDAKRFSDHVDKVQKQVDYDRALDHESKMEQEWEEKIQDYVEEHYPTQTVLSAESTSEQGLREREAMKNDSVLKDMRERAQKATDKAREESAAALKILEEENGGKLRYQKADKREKTLRDEVVGTMRRAGLDVSMDNEDGQKVLDEVNGKARMSAKKRRALETVSVPRDEEHQPTVVSSADGAKVLKELDTTKEKYENQSNRTNTFLGDVAKALGAERNGSASEYATFETKNGRIVTIRLANHNAKVSNFDNRDESEGISIVVSPKKNEGMTNDGAAHVVEYYYDALKLRRAEGKPLADIVRSIKQALYSGEFTDTTGLAERQEVNAEDVVRYNKVYHGSGADFDHFDHSHMGEGEGAQAYGWGTYVTEVEGIGRTYADTAFFNAENRREERNETPLGKVVDDIIGQEKYNSTAKNFEQRKAVAIENLERNIESFEKGLEAKDNEYIAFLKEDMEEDKAKLAILRTLTEDQYNEERMKQGRMRHLYTVEIPDDTGENYLDWDNALTDGQKGVLRKHIPALCEKNYYDDITSYLLGEKGERIYKALKSVCGSYEAASKALSEMGFVGIKYPADYLRGGREDGKKNYVIFDEKDAKITDHVRFFRTANGEAYGYTIGGKIYIDPRIANSETPVHEYAHLWATALRKGNAEEWKNVVELMKDTKVWDEVRKRYPELKAEDDIADEVLATYSGRRGAERLRKEMDNAEGEAKGALARVKEAIRKFWKATADMLHIHYTSAEEVADRVMKDLLDGVDPRKVGSATSDPMKGMEKAAAKYREEQKLKLQKKDSEEDELFVSLQNKKGKEYYDTVTELARRIEQRRNESVRESKETESDRSKHGTESIPAIAGKILNAAYRESHGQVGGLAGETSRGQRKKSVSLNAVYAGIEEWAKRNNCFFNESDIEKNSYDGKEWNGGFESNVYRSKDGKSVIKVTDIGPALDDPISYYIDRNKYFNEVFPESAIEIVGYGRSKDGYPAIITKQQLVDGETVESHFNGDKEKAFAYIDTYLESIGFGEKPKRPIEKEWDLDADGGNDKFSIFDVNPGNIIIDKDGKPHVIDCEVLPLDYNGGDSVHYRIGKPSQPRKLSESEMHISQTVDKVAEQTGGKVKQVHSVDQIENEQVRKDIEDGKEVTGWYDEKTGEVHLYMPNIHDSYTAAKTIWHETVGHKGMRGLLGDKFHTYLRSLWMDMDSPVFEELHKYVKERMAKEPLSMYDAIEEFIADAAEKGKGELGFWNNVKNKVVDALHEIGYRLCPNVKDVKYMLWLAKNVQKHGNDPVWKMRAEAVKWKIEHEKTEYTTTEGGEIRSIDGKPHGFEDMTKAEWDEATDGQVHYRTSPSAATAIDRYHRMLARHGYMAIEAFADNMASVDRLMRAIDPTIKKIEDVSAAMNPYMLRTVLDGTASNKMQRFDADVMQPLDKYMARMIDAVDGKNDKEKIRNFNLYLIKKHGLERNRVFFVRDAVKNMDDAKRKQTLAGFNTKRKALGDQLRKGGLMLSQYYEQLDKWICQNVNKNYKAGEHDYSGMHGMYDIADKKTPYNDIQVQDEVMSVERAMEGMEKGSVEKFWGQVKVATQFSLDEDYQNGFVTKANHESVSGMFDWYVPLRKFDEETAEDVYGYVTEMGDSKTAIGPAIVKAKGRKSLSETNILAQIGAMANYAVVRGSQNKLKQAFALFVRRNGGQGLVTETKVWVEKVGTDMNGNAIWKEVQPDIQEGDTADDIAAKVEAFEQDMEQKKAQGNAKNLTDRGDIGLKFERIKDKDQHYVDVMIAGKTHRFVINGNPRAAQALNGQLENSKTKTWAGKTMKSLTRFMAQMATSYNPEFVLRNAIRDAEFALQNVTAREGVRYGAIYKAYYLKMLPVGVGKIHVGDIKGSTGWGLYAKYREGKLDMNNKTEKWFKEFMENGGETGFVQIKNMQQWEKQYKRDILRERSLSAKTGKALKDFFIGNVECANEVVENMARFAAFCASRHMKRSVQRAAYDAKQVSVNFNRHGSGDAISSFETPDMGKGKQLRRGIYGFTAGYLRNHSMFFNAGAQGTQMMFSNIKNAPVTTIGTQMATPFAFGIAAAMVNAMLIGNEDEKKRKGVKDPYAELPEYIRRNNLCIYLGEGKFVTIPMAIEHRAFYGLGDIAAGLTTNPRLRNKRNVAMDMVGSLSQLFPVIDFMNSAQFDKHPIQETVKGVTPTTLSPFVEWFMNSDWKGAPIRRVGDYSENRPSWKNAYSNTPERLMALNKWANATTNDVDPGNPNMKGSDWADALTDPSMLNHIIGTLGGGAVTTTMRMENALEKWRDTEWNELPVLRNLRYVPQERTNMMRTKSRWYNYVEAMNKTIANYDELGNKNVPVDERIANIAARYKFENTDEYRKVDIIKRTEKQIKLLRKLRSRSMDDKEVTNGIDQQIDLLIQDAVEQLEEYDRVTQK